MYKGDYFKCNDYKFKEKQFSYQAKYDITSDKIFKGANYDKYH